MQQYSITEISQLTGINSITLRAWQRRYGLLKPQRNSKGHRIYNEQDLQRIQHIQQWLARGIAIGKIKDLLNQAAPMQPPIETPYQAELSELNQAIQQLNIKRWERLIQQYLADYPAALVCRHILQPTLHCWQQSAPNTPERVCADVFLQQIQHLLQYRHQQYQHNSRTKPIWFVPISACQPLQPLLWALPLSQQGFRLIESHSAFSVTELTIALDMQPTNRMICYGEHKLTQLQPMLHLQQLAQQQQCQLLILGPIWSIHQSLWQQYGFQGALDSEALQSLLLAKPTEQTI